MSDYSLKEDGDTYEKQFGLYLERRFPNYELFWRKFIVPLTRRSESGDIQIRRGVDPLLEELAMAHYSVYWHMGFSHLLYQTGAVVQFEAIFFHLGSATEMVDRLLFILAKLDAQIGSGVPLAEPLSNEAFHEKVDEYWESQYAKHLERFKETGDSARLNFHTIGEVTSALCKRIGGDCVAARKEWNKVTSEINKYRNALIHNPRLGLLSTGEDPLVPNAASLHKYNRWSKVIYDAEFSDFIRLDTCITNYQMRLESATDRLWQSLLGFLGTLVETPGYLSLLGPTDEGSKEKGSAHYRPDDTAAHLRGEGPGTASRPSGIGLFNLSSGASGISFPPPGTPGERGR